MIMQHPTNPMIFGDGYGRRKVFDAGGFMTAPMHRGQDYVPARAGARVPVYAIADGTVRWTSARASIYNATAGIHAVVEHAGPWRLSTGRLLPTAWAGYCHLTRLNVVPGQQVRQGDQVGLMGATGAATGVHLHLDVFDRHPRSAGSFDSRIDPLSLITPNLAGAPGGATPEPEAPALTLGDNMLIIYTTAYKSPRWAVIGGGGMFLDVHGKAVAEGFEKQIGAKAVPVNGPEYRRIRESQKSQRASTWLARAS